MAPILATTGSHRRYRWLRTSISTGSRTLKYSIGSSADNALAESFNAALKRELLAGRPAFPDQATVYRAVFRWAARYNTRRRHSALGSIAPNIYETAAAATLPEAA